MGDSLPYPCPQETKWYLHIPLEKNVFVLPIEKQKKEKKNLTTLSVDMGIKHLAVITVRKNGKIVFVKFFRCEKIEAHRLRHLQKIFNKQKKSGKAVKGQRSNKQLWKHRCSRPLCFKRNHRDSFGVFSFCNNHRILA